MTHFLTYVKYYYPNFFLWIALIAILAAIWLPANINKPPIIGTSVILFFAGLGVIVKRKEEDEE